MGLTKQLRGMTKEYMQNPKAQYFKYLDKVLNLYKRSNVSKKEVMDHVKKWYSDEKL